MGAGRERLLFQSGILFDTHTPSLVVVSVLGFKFDIKFSLQWPCFEILSLLLLHSLYW